MADYELEEEEEEFDADAAYYGEEPWLEEATESNSPEHLAEEFDTAFASYTDARRRFNELKMARGFLPVVALADNRCIFIHVEPNVLAEKRKGKRWQVKREVINNSALSTTRRREE